MEHQLKIIGKGWDDERGTRYGYDTHPSSKLIVPTEGCLEITLTPNARFRYDLQYVNITLTSGILTLENPARSDFDRTQCFGFFGKNDVLKFGIRLRNEKEMADVEHFIYFELNKREEGRSAGELHIVHGGVINKEDTWEMLSNYYEERFISPRARRRCTPDFTNTKFTLKMKKMKRAEVRWKTWDEERGDLYAYDTHPSSKLMVPTEGCLEITLTPNKLFRYRLQFVNIILTSGIFTLENPARDGQLSSQLFGFFGKNDALKFRIRLKTEEEVVNGGWTIYHGREEGHSVGELHIVHGGVINEEDTWEMLANYYENGLIEARAEWSLHPGFDRLEVYIENEKDEKVKKLEAIYNQKCDAFTKKLFSKHPIYSKMEKMENKPEVVEASSLKKELKKDEKEKSKKIFEKKDWRAENHGLKVVKLIKTASEEPKKDGNKPEKPAKSEKSISKISKKSEKSKKSESHKSAPKEVVAETLVSQNPAPKSNRSDKTFTSGKSQKSALSVKSSSKETVTKTEITQNTELNSSAEQEKVPNQEKKKKKNPCCSIL